MNELDGPDPVKELMLQDKVDKEAEYKERVKVLEEQMAIAAVICFAVKVPPAEGEQVEAADRIINMINDFLARGTEYIRKWPKAAKFD